MRFVFCGLPETRVNRSFMVPTKNVLNFLKDCLYAMLLYKLTKCNGDDESPTLQSFSLTTSAM